LNDCSGNSQINPKDSSYHLNILFLPPSKKGLFTNRFPNNQW